MIKYFNKQTTGYSLLTKRHIGRNPNCTEKWIVAALAPAYICIIKNDSVNGRI